MSTVPTAFVDKNKELYVMNRSVACFTYDQAKMVLQYGSITVIGINLNEVSDPMRRCSILRSVAEAQEFFEIKNIINSLV